ncbi:14946_t:CDS:2 [Dentiscutata heterogama]|uniref:14946_t:CDS:1 n=1 Tax=Dentiscutata heterogama TaxID=1316150 RepID=A0ACA9KRJ2_9GLOM|nr:14946_t:CDS:2 [Dentiscutata heterogama]
MEEIIEENINKDSRLVQSKTSSNIYKSDVWDYVNEETRKCSRCPKIFAPTTATTSIHKDWNIFKQLIQLLAQFNDATIELSSQKYPTIAYAQIILLSIRNELESNQNNEYPLTIVIEEMLSKFIEYYNTIVGSFHIAAFLDPRYKKYCFPNMDNNEILGPIREKLEQQPSLPAQPSKKSSSFYQKLKSTSQNLQLIDDEYKLKL